jgi:hypothetical protein
MPFDGPKFPDPPDPVATANAQGQVNADTARLQQTMNMVDQVGPGYSVRYSRLGPSGQGTGATVGNTGTGTTGTSPYYGTLADGTPISQSNFNADAYLAKNTDVRDALAGGGGWAGKTPWDHYANWGAAEGRTWDGGPAPATAPTSRQNLNLAGIDWSNQNGIADMAYMGLPDKTQWDQIRRDAGFAGEFGNGAFENWLANDATYDQQVKYINSLAGKKADADYIRQLIGQLDSAPGLQNPYSAENTDRWQQTIELDPTQRALYDQEQELNGRLLGLASGQADRVGTALETPLNMDGLPALVSNIDLSGLPELTGNIFGIGTVGGNQALSNGQIDPYGGLSDKATFDGMRRGLGFEGEFGGGAFENWLSGQDQGIKDRYISELRAGNADPDYLRQLGATADPFASLNSLRSKSESALFDRLNPQLERSRVELENRLRNQGVMPGSEAWRNAMDDLNRQQNDARLGVTAQGGDELSRMFAIALQNAQFGNQARNQGFNERSANANLSNAARGQGLSERAYIQNTPINQINSLRSGTQMSMPQAYQPPQTQVQAPDYQGAVYNSAQMAQQQAQAQAQAQSAMLGDIFGLGAGALTGWGTSGFKKFW